MPIDPLVLFFLLAGFILLVWVVGLISHIRESLRVHRPKWPDWGRDARPRRAAKPPVQWTIRGRRAELRDAAVTVDLRGHSPGTLKVVPEPEGFQVAALYGGRDLEVGEPSFDARFVVQASPETLVRAVFSPERRARMIATVIRLDQYGPPTVDLSKERLRLSVAWAAGSDALRQALRDSTTEWVEVLLDVEITADILWIPESGGRVGQCEVCGTAMTSEVVHCARCRTPHHEECWKWTGECSTFACKETRYIAGGRTVSPPPRRQKPDDWLREELQRDRRATGGPVEESIRRFEQRQRERGR